MNQNPQSPTKLTEFAPLSPEDSQTGVGLYISKFFTFGKSKTHSESQSSVQTSSQDVSSSEERPRELISTWNSMDRMGEHSFPVDIAEGRSLPNVLKRISNLLALKRSGLQSYKDTDFKQYWMPDSVSKECYECAEKFTTFRRRHHCRVCGQIFCSRCCNQEIPGKIMGCTGDLRVCTYCCKVVLSYLQSADTAADLSADLRLVQEDLQTKFGNTSTLSSKASNKVNSSGTNLSDSQEVASVRRKTSVGFQEDCFALGRAQECGLFSVEEPVQGLQTLASIRSLLEDIFNPNTGITLQTHRHNLRNCHDCFIGSELVDWLISQGRVSSRLQGTAIGQALLERGFLESVSEQEFVDGYALYFPLKQSKKQWQHEQQLGECQEPLWVKQIPQQDSTTTTDSESDCPNYVQHEFSSLPSSGSTFFLNMNVEENTVSLSRPKDNGDEHHVKQLKLGDGSKCSEDACTELRDEFLSGTLWLQQVESNKASEHKQEENEEEEISIKLGTAYRQLELNLLKQLLNYEALSQSWVDIVLPLVTRIVETVKPNVKSDSDDMDIRQYVQFKKVAGGIRQESCIVNGVVCTKNIAHRAMSSKLSNPRILLLGCSIVYQRIEGRLLSLEPVLMQEHEYLRNVVARIVALQPNVVLVQKGVSRLAQDLLLNQGITLALNVRTSVLERVSRCTQADIVSSVDAHIGRPRLGTCSSFYVKTFQQEAGSKTLMFFEGCALPHLGCTVLLRGASVSDLYRLKKVMNLMIFVRYSWSLEKAFLIDEFACPPDPPKDSFFDELQSSPADCGFPSYSEGLGIKTKLKNVDGKESISKLSAEQDTMEKLEKILNAARSLRFSSESGGDAFDCVTCGNLSSDMKTEQNNANISESDLSPENKQFILEDRVCNSQQCLKDKSPSDEKKINVESVSDFSDPLHSYLNLEDDVFNAEPHNGTLLSVEEVPASNKFRKALDDIILSGSPFLNFSVPYLETEAGRNCVLRKFFPPDIFWSGQFEESSMNTHSRTSSAVHITQIVQDFDNKSKDIKILPKHPFTSAKLTSSVNSKEVQALLANFRACGGRLQKTQTQPSLTALPTQQAALQIPADALHPTNHQHLAVMFCSYAHESNNAPAFCVNPWVVKMDFYGRNDIPLGEFLERYCFRSTYLCPSEGCDVPMLGHVRRFVHDGGCVHILLKGLDQPLPGDNDTIRMWSWCSVCNTTSPIVSMSSGSWSFSFAKFLELRFHGFAYTRRQDSCTHSLHQDHYLYFGLGSVVASFKYTSIMLWEISLPPPMIHISYDSVQQVNVIEEIKKLALKGYDVYSNILERLCMISSDTDVCSLKQQLQREQVHYKSCIEEIQLKLTSPTLEAKKLAGKMAERDVQQLMWHIDDSVVQLKRLISDVVTTWNTRLQELIASTRRPKKNATSSSNLSLDVDEVTVTQEVGVEPDISPPTPSSEKREDELSSPTVTMPMTNQESEENGPLNETIILPVDVIDESSPRIQVRMSHDFSDDSYDGKPAQKSVKNILSQLLPSVGAAAPIQSPLSPQEHHLGPAEASIPVVVYETEPSSIIAYALSSQDYRRGFEEMRGEQTVSSIGSHKGQLDGVQYSTGSAITDHTETQEDPSPSSKPNKSQPSQHIEVQFADSNSNFYCRCYFVEQFANLRILVLPAGEEGYVRSLARCVQWAARGGKSGSSFCKTKDDRFILKEMSKLEMQLFLDFAPHYFSYISRCLSLGQPTLLGKIVGVYRVVFRNSSSNATLRSNLLVMENLFYARQVTHKFDLKGSIRNRLVNPNSDQDGEIVLLDENLLKMTCDSPLYIHPHSKTVLMQAINSDTQFLSSQSVMDYSLLVGLDKDKNELVVGIIDYIRTFTWDKKLETMVKSSGILGGQGKLPTVVSPVLYRARFIAAMHRYFLPVPDRWTGLGKGLDC